MNIAEAAEMIAVHLHRIRIDGSPCPTNMPAFITCRLKCSRGTATMVKQHLVEARRLEVNPIRKIFRIDGQDFLQKIEGRDPLDTLKNTLRRRYSPVYDLRTKERPGACPSADGTPVLLLVGSQVLTLDQAKDVAGVIEAKESRHAG